MTVKSMALNLPAPLSDLRAFIVLFEAMLSDSTELFSGSFPAAVYLARIAARFSSSFSKLALCSWRVETLPLRMFPESYGQEKTFHSGFTGCVRRNQVCVCRQRFVAASNSVCPRKNRSFRCWFTTINTCTGTASSRIPLAESLIDRDATHGRPRFFLDLRLAVRAPAPPRIRKAHFHCFLQLVICLRVMRVGLAESQRFLVQRLLNFREQFFDRLRHPRKRRADLPFSPRPVAPRQHCCLLGHILGPQFHTQRNPTHLPIVEFPAGTRALALVQSHSHVGCNKFRF